MVFVCHMIELAYLGFVANEFIYDQWERKGMHADIYVHVQCNMGPQANVLHFAIRISL